MRFDNNFIAETKKDKPDIKKQVFSFIGIIVYTVIAVSLFMTLVFRMYPVRGESMEPTFIEGDRVLTTNIHGAFKRNDIVVIKSKIDTVLIKRIIALEGDKVDIDFENGNVYVNDELLDEPFINEKTKERINFKGPVIVPQGHVFVLGDNRNKSSDSRDRKIGMIDRRNILGKVILRVYPLNKFGTIKTPK